MLKPERHWYVRMDGQREVQTDGHDKKKPTDERCSVELLTYVIFHCETKKVLTCVRGLCNSNASNNKYT
jgi:hypothetical protein